MPPLLPIEEIQNRLEMIFPRGVPNREFIIRLNTVRTVFAALYIGAVEGADRWLAPRHIYRMRPEIAAIEDEAARLAYYRKVPPSGSGVWYADNSREGARDERLAVAAKAWRQTYLSGAALARAALVQGMASEGVEIFLPQGGSIVLPAGESPGMTKQVVEVFAKKFLTQAAVVWISDSREKLFRDERLAKAMQIELDAARLLPDVILVDMDPPGRPGRLLVVFVEVVFSDGPVDEGRQAQLWDVLARSPRAYAPADAAFVTVYADRGARPAARAARELAWGSFAWFVSEPDHLVQFHGAPPRMLSMLL